MFPIKSHHGADLAHGNLSPLGRQQAAVPGSRETADTGTRGRDRYFLLAHVPQGGVVPRCGAAPAQQRAVQNTSFILCRPCCTLLATSLLSFESFDISVSSENPVLSEPHKTI